MRRRVLVTLCALLLSGFVGAYTAKPSIVIGAQSPAVTAQAMTPVPGRHSEVHAAFPFLVKDAPSQLGWRAAEYKNEYGRQFWKADVLPGCGEWQAVPGDTRPGLLLTPGGADCPGFVIDFGVIYGWNESPILTPTTSPTSTATVGPPPDGATATPSPTVAGSTSTPSPLPLTPTATGTPTPAPIGTPTILYGNMCRPDPTPVYPKSITIYGQGGLTAPAFFWWCAPPSATPDLVIVVPKATFEAAYDDGPRKLLQSLGR